MNGSGIIIADKDAAYRQRMAKFFTRIGYQVDSAASAEATVNRVLENHASVLLLGNNLCDGYALADLVDVLKQCDNRLYIILVADELSLPETAKVRAAGVFYHALKPASAADTDELRQAVTCAFEELADLAPLHREAQVAVTPVRAWAGAQLGRTVSWVAATVALCLLLLKAATVELGGNLTTWIFLGFVALIITQQLLPIFNIKLVLRTLREWKEAHSGPHRGGR